MKARLSFTLAGAALILTLALSLTAGAAVPPALRPSQAHLLPPSRPVEGDYHWSPLGGPVAPGGQVYGLDVHPTLPGTLYAAASAPLGDSAGPSTLFKSTDGAASWTPLFEAGNTVLCLAAGGSNVYAGAFQHSAEEVAAIYVSNDAGGTWNEAFSFDNRSLFTDVSVDPADPDRAILGGMHHREGPEDGVVYGTLDGGATWDELLRVYDPTQHSLFMAVLISPHDPDLVFATMRGNGPGTQVYRSTDGGATWADVATIPGVNAGSLVAHPTDPDVLYAGTGCVTQAWWGPCQVYRSPDAGFTWDLVLPDSGGTVRFEPPSTVYALSGQLWASASDGDSGTWSQVGAVPDGTPRFDLDLGVSPTALYAGLASSGVATSTDGGVSWQDATNGITAPVAPRDIDVDPVNLDKIFVSAEGGRGGFRSDDGGSTWTALIGGDSLCFEIQPGDPDVVYAGAGTCSTATVKRSTDGGLSFSDLYTPPWFQPDCSGGDEQIVAVEVAASDPSTVYAAGEAQPAGQDRRAVALVTHDGGATWNEQFVGPQGSGFNTVAANPQDAQEAWAGGYDRSAGPWNAVIYRTQDGGTTWQQVFFDDENNVRTVVVDPVNPDVLYAACDQAYDVYRSEDGGDTWNLIRSNNPPFQQPSGNKLAIDPNDHNRVYLGGWGYIAESPDGGATWIDWPINAGMLQSEPRALAVDAGNPVQTLYAGLSGLWAHTRPAPASGDRYVATGGDDYMNSCTYPPNPCLTVGHAVGQANPGEAIRVAGGTYVENVYLDKPVILEGGYSGPPGWTRDLGLYETVLDGSGDPTIPGDWDGNQLHAPTVLHNGAEYEMWYTGWDMVTNSRLGRATGGETVWAKSPENPLLDGSEAFVLLESGLYRMWYSQPDGQCLWYAWSNDGLAWNEEPDPALCAPHDGSWDSDGVWDPNIVVDGGGTYWMFYEGANWGYPEQVQIGCATGPDGLEWTRCAENPVLSPGDPGAWDGQWALDPAVLLEGTDWKMWFRGHSYAGESAIGHATSPDGVTWTKDAGNPVLAGTPGTWDENNLHAPSVWYDGASTYHLWYASNGRIGHASSPDGLAWTKTPDPVLEPGWYGEWGEPVVRFTGGSQGAVLDGFTVTGGDGQGGIRIENTEAQVTGCTVTGNRSDTHWGGGINVDGGSQAAISHCSILDNVAGSAGGLGVHSGSTVSLVESEVAGNSTTWGAGGGLGVWSGSTLTGTGCQVHGNATPSAGGGIEIADGSTATFSQTAFVQNAAQDSGGGLRVVHSSSLTFVDGQVTGNTSGWLGGGIFSDNGTTLHLQGATLSGNVAGNLGGGLAAWGTALTVHGTTFTGNQSQGEGGGLVLANGTNGTLSAVTVDQNWAEHGTGGMDVRDGSQVSLDGISITNNTSRWGTALRVLSGATLTGNRVRIQGNVATDQNTAAFQVENGSTLNLINTLINRNEGGVGDVWGGSTLNLTHVTIADNYRNDGWAGVHVSGDASAAVHNSILAWNGVADLWCDDPGTCAVESSNLEHAWPGPGNISLRPRFVDRAAWDYHLAGGSPGIEAASPAFMPGDDFDGDARPYDGDGDGNALPDMGADEYTGPPMPIEPLVDLYVDGSVQIAGTGTPEDPYSTVGEALGEAWPGDTIHVAEGTYLENLDVAKSVSILGGYSGVPDWLREPATYVTVLDGSSNPSVPGDWDGNLFGMPYVVWDPNGAEYKMYYNGSDASGRTTIGLATSPDGLAWAKYTGNPVLVPDQPWEGGGVNEPYVRVEGPGDYKMWYDNSNSVGYATSSDGITWTKQPDPIFGPNPDPGAWDGAWVRASSVVKPGADYLLYYCGGDGSGRSWMGFATSPDGLNWTRHGDPVLSPGDPGEWDDWRVYRPDVTYAGGLYHALYVGVSQTGTWKMGVATSPDGVGWTKYGGNPVLPGTEPWENQTAWGAGHFLDGAVWKAWYVGIGDGGTGFGIATSDDGLAWTPDDEHNPLLEPGNPGQNGAPVVNIHSPTARSTAGWARSDGWARSVTEPSTARWARSVTEPSGPALPDQSQVLLDGLTVSGGTYWNGAGVHVENAQATLHGVKVIGNQSLGSGGGVAAYNWSLVELYDSQLLDNTAHDWGGGLDAAGGSHVNLLNVEVRGNQAVTGEGGGLLFHDDDTEGYLADVQVIENQADGGGGISLTNGPNVRLVMDRVEIARNVARWAAGMRPYYCTVVGDRVWIVDNVATEEGCGGFNADNADVTFTNTLIAGNAGNAGCAHMGTLSLTNVTVADNTRSDGNGGIGIGSTGVATVRNSIFYFNGNDDLGCDPAATCTVEYSDLEHPWPGPGNISADPEFVNRPSGDYHIQVYSPAVEQADPGYAPDHDIDGQGRPVDGDGDGIALPDMGADEYPCTTHLWKMKLNWAYAARPGYVKLVDLGVVHNQYHMKVAGATVFGHWTLPDGAQVPDTAVTDYLGRFKFRYKGPWAPPGIFRFDVDGIQYDACGYDAGANETDPWRQALIPPP